ncbi:MAG: hypothetical protein WAM91_01585 [Candidatus Acidiferrales bacterium]
MSAPETIVQYTGFKAQGHVREYNFTVRETTTEQRDFTLSISNEAFTEHRARYQDAPDICSIRLRRELAATANHPAEMKFCVGDAELTEYYSARPQRNSRSRYPNKKAGLAF